MCDVSSYRSVVNKVFCYSREKRAWGLVESNCRFRRSFPPPIAKLSDTA